MVNFTEKCFSKTADMYLEWDHAENGVPLLARKEVVRVASLYSASERAVRSSWSSWARRHNGSHSHTIPGQQPSLPKQVKCWSRHSSALWPEKKAKSEKFLSLPQVSGTIDWKKTEVHCTPCSFQAPQTLELPLELSAELQDLWINYLSVDQWLGGMFE